MSCELSFRAVLPVDRKVIVIAVGAAYDILVDEAHHTRIFMRLQETKGSMEFHEDLIRYYASNHGGLNEYQNGQWIKRDSSLVEQHWKPWKELASEDQENQHKRNRRIFTSSLKQQLVLSRLQRRAGYDPEHAMNLSASHSAAATGIGSDASGANPTANTGGYTYSRPGGVSYRSPPLRIFAPAD